LLSFINRPHFLQKIILHDKYKYGC
jgi:hypothetical protein